MKTANKKPASGQRGSVVTEPVLKFEFPSNDQGPKRTIELYIYDAGQFCSIPGYKHFLGGGKTGGIVYVNHDCNGYRWEEGYLENKSHWEWIAEWMTKGFVADGLMTQKETVEVSK